jgi:hypothetical protein
MDQIVVMIFLAGVYRSQDNVVVRQEYLPRRPKDREEEISPQDEQKEKSRDPLGSVSHSTCSPSAVSKVIVADCRHR